MRTFLEIEFDSGDRRTVELDRRQTLSVGRHPSNDVSISGDDVEPMHCRISWNKQAGYEVVAGGTDGIDLNGTLIKRARLAPGDVLRVGPANILFQEESGSPPETADFEAGDLEPSVFSLKPLSGEIDFPLPPLDHDESPLAANEILADDPPLTADEILSDVLPAAEIRRRTSSTRGKQEKREREHRRREPPAEAKPRKKPADFAESARDEDPPDGEIVAQPVLARGQAKPSDGPEQKEGGDRGTASSPPATRFRPRPKRPGDRDPARSPLVLSLGGGAFVLLLVGATFYFILGRQTTQAQFNEAQALMDEGKYLQAITAFGDFLALHPRDSLADQAQIQMWISRIEQYASGASPDWSNALTELNGFITVRRDVEGFNELHDTIRERAEAIAEGAAAAAGKSHDRKLLGVSDEAATLVKTFAPQDAPPTDALKRIQTAWRNSEAAILKHESFTSALAEIDAALKERQTIVALRNRRELLARYPEYAKHPTVAEKLRATLRTERELVSRSDEGVEALTDDRESAFPRPLSFAVNARARTDEVSVGRSVFGIAQGCCYAVDSITGEPVWRRAVGWEAPFFPVPVTTSAPSLLVFDSQHNELALLDQQSGRLLWRQPGVAEVTGTPLIEEGHAYVVHGNGLLSKVDLGTGRVISQLTFSQPVSSPALLMDGARLVVSGDQEVVYTLTKRPLECAAVSFLGQKPQSIAAPLLSMGALLLIAENLAGERCLLHVLDTRYEHDELRQVAEFTIPGHVTDAPVIRGRDLFVPSSGERLSSFTVSDEAGQPPLTEGPRFEGEGRELSPVFLATGPDRQVWMSGRKLRRLRLAEDVVDPGQQVLDVGATAQPLQQLGKKVYVGRTLPSSSALTLLQIDRDQFASQWQTVLGARLLALGVFPNQEGCIAVTDAGQVYRVSPSVLDAGGFLAASTLRIELPDGLTGSLDAAPFADGQIAVWCGDPKPQLWLINRLGQIDRNVPLPGVLQTAPVKLGSQLALPLSGRIHLLAEGGTSQQAVQEFGLPQGDAPPPAWRQLVALDETSLIAVTQGGELRLLRRQDSPQPYLAEAGLVQLGQPMEHGLAQAGGTLAVAVGDELQLLDGAALEPLDETKLPGAVSNDVWFSGGCVFVETDRKLLQCFRVDEKLAQQWSVPLPNTSLISAPYVAEDRRAVLISLADGSILCVNAETGAVQKQASVEQALSRGPQPIGAGLVVTTEDGSLIRVDSMLDGQ